MAVIRVESAPSIYFLLNQMTIEGNISDTHLKTVFLIGINQYSDDAIDGFTFTPTYTPIQIKV